jgi:hypothetical protein
MKSLRVFPLAAFWLLFLPLGSVEGSTASTDPIESVWSEQELFAKSDLVVIATPTVSKNSIGRKNSVRSHLIHLKSDFAVSKVIKGDKTIKTLVLDHYCVADWHAEYVPPFLFGLLLFDPAMKHTFRLFLKRGAFGQYVPVGGQLHNLYSSIQIIGKWPAPY